MRAILALALVVASGMAWAQQPAPVGPPEPKVQRIVVEDDAVRIEELRVRGQTQRIVVKPKHAAEYEIVPPTGGRDPSQNRGNQQAGAAGQRVWNLLRF
jgi:hypothetical protein